MQNLEVRNAALEKDVKLYLERRDIEKQAGCHPRIRVDGLIHTSIIQLELYDLILPFKEYVESKKEYEILKRERQRKHDQVLALQEKNKPFVDFKRCVLM